MRIAINGMGRIGRLLFRRLVMHSEIELIAVNDIMPADNLAYLLKYDSIYGTFENNIGKDERGLLVNNKTISVLQCEKPTSLPWKEMQIDVVLECSGKFTSADAAALHLEAGAKKVLLSTTGSVDIPLLIFGFNEKSLTKETSIFSPGGCMTNCSVHLINILKDVGIEALQINILHSYTSRQEIVDAPNKNFRRGRAAAESIIPVEIDLAQSLERLFPSLENNIKAMSTRVPVANGAMADFTFQLKNEISLEEVNAAFLLAAENSHKGIIEYSNESLVSTDIKGNKHSCIIDSTLTSMAGKQLKIIAWFDNEFGFTSRMIDWLGYLNKPF